MQLKKVHGLAAADSVLKRIDPLDLSSLPDAALQRTRDLFGLDATPESSVLQMLRDVRADGDSAVRRYAKLLDNADVGDLEVPAAELDGAWEATPDDLKHALNLAAERITQFHEATLPRDWVDLGGGLGELIRPLERVGLYAPGGTAAYPSTVLMTAIPARVAGVREVVLATPRRGNEPLNTTVLAAARIAGSRCRIPGGWRPSHRRVGLRYREHSKGGQDLRARERVRCLRQAHGAGPGRHRRGIRTHRDHRRGG